MRHLSFLDQGFLEMESRDNPLHVGVVQLFDASSVKTEKSRFLANSLTYLRSQIGSVEPFNSKIVKPFMGRPEWAVDNRINYSNHIIRHTLPEADLTEVMSHAVELHEKKMERDRPLWQLYSFENLRDDMLAFYFKVHHACMDGVGGMRLLQSFLSKDPAEKTSERPQPKKKQDHIHLPGSNIFSFVNRAAQIFKDETAALKEMTASFIQDHKDHQNPKDHLLPLPFTAPQCRINGHTNESRAMAVRSYSVASFKKARRKFGVTVNDLVLAMCSSALRNYLIHEGELPANPLIAFIPVSVRTAHGSDGNQIGFILVNLATHLSDPVKRLELINASTHEGKEQLGRMSKDAVRRHAEMIFALASMSGASSILDYLPPMFNVVISNVPAARHPLYLNGVPMQSIYPVSVLFATQGLNITLMNYAGNLDFGLIGCSKQVRNIGFLADCLDEGYNEIMQLTANG